MCITPRRSPIYRSPTLDTNLQPADIQHADATATFPSRQFRETRKHIVFVFALLVLLGLCWKIRHVLGIVYLSGLLAVVLNPVVLQISKLSFRGKPIPKPLAVVILVVGLAVFLFLLFWFGLPPILNDFRNFLADAPTRVPVMLGKLQHMPMADKIGLNDMNAKAAGALGSVATYIFSSLPALAEHLLDIVTAAILCIYFILEGQEVYEFFLSLVVPRSRNRLANTLLVAETRVSRWLIGQLALMAIVGLYSIIVFRVINVRYFLLLGVLMGLTNIIPVAGNLATILLVALIAAADSWAKAGFVILAYAIYVQIENAFLTPRIMKSSVDLMGVTVLIALLVGTAISGIPGALVAVPSAAVVVVFANEYLVQHEDPERLSVLD